MAGRKTKLTPQVQDLIVQALGVGTTREHACQFAGISHESFYNWLEKGAAGLAPYVDFLEAVKAVEGKAVVGWLALIDSAARAGNWQAAAWKLERRYPKDYGRRMLEVSGNEEHPLRVLLTHLDRMPDAELHQMLAPQAPLGLPHETA